MEFIGIDVHKRDSQVCILTTEGEVVERRIRTERGRFAEVLDGRPGGRILIEASTESEWVARCLESLGHEVVVADPNFSPMYATRSRKVKTDKRDARTLAEACRLGAYKPAHRTSDARRHLRAQLAVREALVRTDSAGRYPRSETPGPCGSPQARRGRGPTGDFFPHFSPTRDMQEPARTSHLQREKPQAALAHPRFVISRSPVQIRMSAPIESST